MKKRIWYMLIVSLLFIHARTPPSQNTIQQNNTLGIEFIFVHGGTFQMGDVLGNGDGDEKQVHPVTVSDFYLSKAEITVAQYRAFCKATRRKMPPAPEWGMARQSSHRKRELVRCKSILRLGWIPVTY